MNIDLYLTVYLKILKFNHQLIKPQRFKLCGLVFDVVFVLGINGDWNIKCHNHTKIQTYSIKDIVLGDDLTQSLPDRTIL